MTKIFINQLAEVASRIRAMRANLPNVDSEELARLNHQLAEIDLSHVEEDEVAQLQEAYVLLAAEIKNTMEKLNEYCDEMRAHLDEVQQHSDGVKAYAVTQNTK